MEAFPSSPVVPTTPDPAVTNRTTTGPTRLASTGRATCPIQEQHLRGSRRNLYWRSCLHFDCVGPNTYTRSRSEMTSAVTISALASRIAHGPADLPIHRPHLRIVETDPDVTPARPPLSDSDIKAASAIDERDRAELTRLVAELAELEVDRCTAGEMTYVTEWLAEISTQRCALRARARILCTRLGLHRPGGCPSCCPPPPRTGVR